MEKILLLTQNFTFLFPAIAVFACLRFILTVFPPVIISLGKYKYSDEANRVGLVDFLDRVQKTYYEYNRHALPWQPEKTDQVLVDDLRERLTKEIAFKMPTYLFNPVTGFI